MKKKLLVLAAAALSLTVAVSGTLAYFTDSGTAHNIITTGGVDIVLVETTDKKGEDGNFLPFRDVSGVMPGATVSKIVQVENVGKTDAWIRVKVEPSITAQDGSELSLTLGDNTKVLDMDFDIGNDGNWLKHDGYYYYKHVMKYDAEHSEANLTEPLFREVKFDKLMGNEYQNCRVEIKVTAQATQFRNNDPRPEGVTVLDDTTMLQIKGWPDIDTEKDDITDDTDNPETEQTGADTEQPDNKPVEGDA